MKDCVDQVCFRRGSPNGVPLKCVVNHQFFVAEPLDEIRDLKSAGFRCCHAIHSRRNAALVCGQATERQLIGAKRNLDCAGIQHLSAPVMIALGPEWVQTGTLVSNVSALR
jgi:hypothetical protein